MSGNLRVLVLSTTLISIYANLMVLGDPSLPPEVSRAKILFKEIENKCGVRVVDDDEDENENDDEESESERQGRESMDYDEREEQESQDECELGRFDEGDQELNDTEDPPDVLAEGVAAVEKVEVLRERRASVSSQGTGKRKRVTEGKSFLILLLFRQQLDCLYFNVETKLTATPRTGKTPEELNSLISETTKRRRKMESVVEETAEVIRSRSGSSNDLLQVFMLQMQNDREERRVERQEREERWRREREEHEAERREERAGREERQEKEQKEREERHERERKERDEREEKDRNERDERDKRHQELMALLMGRK